MNNNLKAMIMLGTIGLLILSTLAVGIKTNPLNILTCSRLVVTPSSDFGESTSTGGAINIQNQGNIGAGIILFTNLGASADGRLFNIRSDNNSFPQSAFHVDYHGNTNAVEIVANQDDSSAQALNVVSTNVLDTTVGIQGEARSRGVMKLTHVKDGDDTGSSALSIMLEGDGSKCHGVYVNTGANFIGDLLCLRSNSIDKFTVDSQGSVSMGSLLHLTPLQNEPSNPHEGDIYFNGVTHKYYGYDGTFWKSFW